MPGSEEKTKFVLAFESNGKGKNLGWVTTYGEKVIHTDNSEEVSNLKWKYGPEVLTDAGFGHVVALGGQLYDEFLNQVIQDSEQMFDYTVQVKDRVLIECLFLDLLACVFATVYYIAPNNT